SAAPTTISADASTPATVKWTAPAPSSTAATPAPIIRRLIVSGVRKGRRRGRRTRGLGGSGHGAVWVHALVGGGGRSAAGGGGGISSVGASGASAAAAANGADVSAVSVGGSDGGSSGSPLSRS